MIIVADNIIIQEEGGMMDGVSDSPHSEHVDEDIQNMPVSKVVSLCITSRLLWFIELLHRYTFLTLIDKDQCSNTE